MSAVPTFAAVVDVDGRLHLAPEQADERRSYLRTLRNKRVVVTIREKGTQRSLDQNAWIWGVAYPLLAETFGYDADEIEDLHYGLLEKWAGTHFDHRMRVMVPNKRSSKLTTKEFSDYMEWLVRFGAKSGVTIPLPDEATAA